MGFCRCLKIILISILTIILNLGAPLFFLALSPIYLYRFIVFKLAPYIRPQMGKMLTTRSSLSAIDSIHDSPNINLMVGMQIEGHIDLEKYRKHFMDKVVLSKNDQTGELRRAELRQYITKFAGFFFWHPEKNFRVEEHIKDYSSPKYNVKKELNEKDLREIVIGLVKHPHPVGKSPWLIKIVRNFVATLKNGEKSEPRTIILWVIHHSICDGFSIAKILAEILEKRPEDVLIEHLFKDKPKPSFFKLFWKSCCFASRALCEFFPTILDAYDINDWRFPENQMTKEVMGSFRDRIPMDYLKEIKYRHNVGVTSVLFSACTAAIREFMISSGVKVPKIVHAFIPIPVPGHPDKLRNHMTLGLIELPVGISEPVQRLHVIHQSIEKIKKSTFPGVMFIFMKLVGGLFPFMIKKFVRNTLLTCAVTSMPGSKYHGYLFGFPATDIMFACGLLPGNLALGFTTISYNAHFNIVGGADRKIMPSYERAEELLDCVINELEILKKASPDEFV